MAYVTIPQSDGGYTLQLTLTDSSSTAFDLTGYTPKLKVWEPNIPGTLLLDGTCVVTNTTGGVCTYSIETTNFSTVGRYRAEVEATNTAGARVSFESFTVTVIESG